MKTNRTVVGVDTAKRVFQLHWVDMESARLTGAVQPVKVRREGEGKPPLPPRVMGRHPRGWRLSVDRGTCGQGH